MKYRKKPVVVEAVQWFVNGDHPDDDCHGVLPGDRTQPFLSEGKVVRYFRRPDVDGTSVCDECKNIFNYHGWIDTKEDGHRVCPGDWIITGIQGERYPCKPGIFRLTYDQVPE